MMHHCTLNVTVILLYNYCTVLHVICRLDDGDESFANYCSVPITNEFHKVIIIIILYYYYYYYYFYFYPHFSLSPFLQKWLGVVQGNQPCTLESAVKVSNKQQKTAIIIIIMIIIIMIIIIIIIMIIIMIMIIIFHFNNYCPFISFL